MVKKMADLTTVAPFEKRSRERLPASLSPRSAPASRRSAYLEGPLDILHMSASLLIMARRNGSRRNGQVLAPMVHSALAEAFHQRFLYLFDESLGRLLRDNPEVEERLNVATAEIFELLAAGPLHTERRAPQKKPRPSGGQ